MDLNSHDFWAYGTISKYHNLTFDCKQDLEWFWIGGLVLELWK